MQFLCQQESNINIVLSVIYLDSKLNFIIKKIEHFDCQVHLLRLEMQSGGNECRIMELRYSAGGRQ